MSPIELIEQAEADVSVAGPLLRRHRNIPGLSSAFWDRVLQCYATNPSELKAIAPVAPLVVRYGDNPALSLRALGVVSRATGQWNRSADAFIASGEAATNARDRYAFQTGAVDALARAGRVDQALDLARRLRAGLNDLGEHGLAARVALNAACALMNQDRYAEAWETLEGVPEALEKHGFLAEAASARLELSTSRLFGGSLGQAFADAEAAIAISKRADAPYVADVAAGNLACIEILRGQADLALTRLLALRTRFGDAPVDLARTLEYLGDAYLRLNLWSEASDAYREAEVLGAALPVLQHGHLALGVGRAKLASGRAAEAQQAFRRAIRYYRRVGNLAWESAAVLALAEAKSDAKRADRAVALARSANSPEHLARALVVANGIRPSPGHELEARKLLGRGHGRGLRWRLDLARAQAARNAGDRSSSLAAYRRMFRAILADRLLTSSFASRTAFMRDKSTAVREYVEYLLQSPRPPALREVLRVVGQSRSVALLDEMLSLAPIPDSVRQELEQVREQFQTDRDEAGGRGGIPLRRRVVSAGVRAPIATLQRRWLELTHESKKPVPSGGAGRTDTVVAMQTRAGFDLIAHGRHLRLAVRSEDIDRELRWLNYELQMPIIDPEVPCDQALGALRDMADRLLTPWVRSDAAPHIGLCPDGSLWRVPWLALASVLPNSPDLELRLHPSMHGSMPDFGEDIVIWLADHANLPNAVAEAEAIARTYPKALVCRTSAAARDVLRAGEVGALHVIAHARLRWDNPMLSSIDFPDGPVLAAEVARAPVRIGLATLAACDTGRLSNLNQDEPEGLVRAFLARGAGFVVGSAWTLDDAAACTLYAETYRYLRDGGTLWTSLRAAQANLRQSKPHPYFWASPVVYGGYSH